MNRQLGTPSRRTRALALAAVLVGLGAAAVTPAAEASTSRSLINGSGSSWSSNAVTQWIADVQTRGLQVVFTATGSATGRKDFAQKTTDFGVSDIGFQGADPQDPTNVDDSLGRAFAYLPIVAGGTGFPYHITVGGQLVRNLRLSGLTLARIFTNQITNWSDPAITADNNGRKLPSIKIIPVVHSEGSGSTAQFTRYLDTVYPSIWRPFNGASGLTEYYPRKGSAIAQNGSDGVMNFIAAGSGNGSIGYDEYSYALGKNYPVAKILNAGGYYTLPNQYNVAVALTQAKLNLDKSDPNKYLLQNLDKVYTYSDPRTYPLSSYSYMIIPTAANDPKMTTSKRQTLADYLTYAVCEGQKEMGPIGYSPLPLNLVQASFDQTKKLKAADPGVDIANVDVKKCNNPTFDAKNPSRNYLSEIAPKPLACDKQGAGPCSGTVNANNANPVNGKAPTPAKTGTTGTSGTTGASGGTGTGGAVDPAASPSPAATDPTTGEVTNPDGATTTAEVFGSPTEIAAARSVTSNGALPAIVAGLVLLAVFLPPILARRFRSSASGGPR
jgi:phosphate transport system substrate-binding protein